ncbi:MAG: hypothetical protein KAI66_27280, partial [Lentisphaeria bacterium]|nr:hypothetical protein [Lentisphaeria bacterium]
KAPLQITPVDMHSTVCRLLGHQDGALPAPKRHFVVRPPLAHSAPTPPSTSRAAPRSIDPVRTCHCHRCYATILIRHHEVAL